MAFGMFKVVAGDFKQTDSHQLIPGREKTFLLPGTVPTLHMRVAGKFSAEKIPASEIESLELATEESVKRLGGTVGWGIAGAALLGPVGLLAGLLAGGKGKDVTFVCTFKDGRKFMAVAPSQVWNDLMAATFK